MKSPENLMTDRFFERVVAVLDVTGESRAIMASAAELARHFDVGLTSLFAHNDHLRSLEGHPLVRIVDLPTGIGHPLEGGALKMGWRALGRRMRHEHERLVRRYALEAKFEISGRSQSEAVEERATGSELFVLGSVSRRIVGQLRGSAAGLYSSTQMPGAVLLVGATQVSFYSVVVVYDGSALARRALEAARRMARNNSAMVTVLTVGAGVEDIPRLRQRARTRRGTVGERIQVYCRRLEQPDTQAVIAASERLRADLIVVPASETFPATEDLPLLTAQGARPVLIIRGQPGTDDDRRLDRVVADRTP